MVKAIVWDFDGVLINSINNFKDVMKNIFEEYFLEYDEPILNKTGVKERFYENFKKGLENNKSEKDVSYHEFLKMIKNNPKFKTNKELVISQNISVLKSSHEKGILNVLGTNSNKERIFAILEELDIMKYFDFVQTSCDVKHPKPHPDFIINILNKFNLKAKEVVFIDDDKEAIYAGVNSGVKTILYIQDDYEDDNVTLITNDLTKINFKDF